MFERTREHSVKCNGTILKPVHVLDPRTEDDLQQMVADGSETWLSICTHYHNAKAVAMQAARRREVAGKGIPPDVKQQIYDALDEDEKMHYMTAKNGMVLLEAKLYKVWTEMQADKDELTK